VALVKVFIKYELKFLLVYRLQTGRSLRFYCPSRYTHSGSILSWWCWLLQNLYLWT